MTRFEVEVKNSYYDPKKPNRLKERLIFYVAYKLAHPNKHRCIIAVSITMFFLYIRMHMCVRVLVCLPVYYYIMENKCTHKTFPKNFN